MVYSLQGVISFGSAARRDQAYADLTTFIANRPRWSADDLDGALTKAGFPALSFLLRFVTEADADALEERIKTFLTSQRTPRDGSEIRAHRCRHDEGSNLCPPGRVVRVIGGVWTVI